jgi:hypothetical protein
MIIEPINNYIHCKTLETPKQWQTFGVTSYEFVENIDTKDKLIIPQSYSKITLPDGTFLIKQEIVVARVISE